MAPPPSVTRWGDGEGTAKRGPADDTPLEATDRQTRLEALRRGRGSCPEERNYAPGPKTRKVIPATPRTERSSAWPPACPPRNDAPSRRVSGRAAGSVRPVRPPARGGERDAARARRARHGTPSFPPGEEWRHLSRVLRAYAPPDARTRGETPVATRRRPTRSANRSCRGGNPSATHTRPIFDRGTAADPPVGPYPRSGAGSAGPTLSPGEHLPCMGQPAGSGPPVALSEGDSQTLPWGLA
jgi:hypothetical protein